jgi:hypothetical protein
MITSTFFDWPFLILVFGVGTVTPCIPAFNNAGPLDLPMWVTTSKAGTILGLINVPFAWAATILGIYGFLILPWYTVLICLVTDMIFGGLFYGWFLMPIQRFSLVAALLVSYLIAAIAIIWYCAYVGASRTITLNTSACIAIAVLICYNIVNIFLARKTLKG